MYDGHKSQCGGNTMVSSIHQRIVCLILERNSTKWFKAKLEFKISKCKTGACENLVYFVYFILNNKHLPKTREIISVFFSFVCWVLFQSYSFPFNFAIYFNVPWNNFSSKIGRYGLAIFLWTRGPPFYRYFPTFIFYQWNQRMNRFVLFVIWR